MTRARFELVRVNRRETGWRFIASNNYVIAVGGDGLADVAAARATLAALQCTLPEARSTWYQDPAGRWRWDLRSSGAVLAKSSRWYHSRIVCESTLADFLHDAPDAPVVDPLAARILTSSMRRFGRSR